MFRQEKLGTRCTILCSVCEDDFALAILSTCSPNKKFRLKNMIDTEFSFAPCRVVPIIKRKQRPRELLYVLLGNHGDRDSHCCIFC